MRSIAALFLLGASMMPFFISAQDRGVLGYWQEPGGSIIHVEQCGGDVCASIAAISPTAPGRIDGNNPDATLRNRSLCGVRIGEGFQLNGSDKAENGRLYDPKSGKTYRGTMASAGDTLKLRGYIGIAAFGRTEIWKRTTAVPTCKA